jgi:hypothetical protein
MKKSYLYIFLTIILISIVSANTCNIPHEQGKILTFSFSDPLAGECNVSTIDHPNGTIRINQQMTKIGNTFNSTILAGNFTILGEYRINLECSDGYGNVCRNVTEYGIEVDQFILYALFYCILLFGSWFLVYKFATYNGGKLRDYNFYFWAAFLDMILFVIIEINGFGGSNTLIVDVIKYICLGSGLYFLAQGIIPAVSWKKSAYS